MKSRFFWFFLIASVWICNALATEEPIDLQYRYGRYYTTFAVNQDGTATESREWSVTVLKESAVSWAKHAAVTYSTSVQKAEIVEAYTRKADGKRIDVAKDSYQLEVNSGKGNGGPAFSDWTTLSLVFPDVAVGDTVVLSYRLTLTDPLFPNQFSEQETFSPQTAFDDVKVRIDYPSSLWAQYEARQMTVSKNSEANGRKVLEWTYSNPKPLKSERRDYSVYDPEKDPGFAFSTFKTYADIAAAYGVRAVPKAAPTERIRKLAEDIVKDRKSEREQARALYDWVATNITYGGNCIGVGAVVPRDVDVILDNKMGDCKDHATLLQALLAARGIKSTQALVNAGSVYTLAKIPVVSMVNHVIDYIPSMDLYVDSTSDSTPFGMLPFSDQDKPVLLVENYAEGTKTPPTRFGDNQEKMRSVLKIAQDGSVSGTVDISQKGVSAAGTREMARNLTKNAENDFVKNIFRARGQIGSGTLEKDDPTALDDSYQYKASFTMEKFVKMPGSGALYVYPLIGSPNIAYAASSSLEPETEADATCSNGRWSEEYLIELPKNMKILSVPQNLKITNDVVSYQASFRLKGHTLTVKRLLEDRTKGNVCSPQYFAEFKKIGEKIADNLKEPVLYK